MGMMFRAALVALLLPALAGCVRARMAREYRKPYSKDTKVAEDVAFTLETAAMGLVAIGTIGLINPFEPDGTSLDNYIVEGLSAEDEEESPRVDTGFASPEEIRAWRRDRPQRQAERARGRRRVLGTRREP